jgi:hypothetical protein
VGTPLAVNHFFMFVTMSMTDDNKRDVERRAQKERQLLLFKVDCCCCCCCSFLLLLLLSALLLVAHDAFFGLICCCVTRNPSRHFVSCVVDPPSRITSSSWSMAGNGVSVEWMKSLASSFIMLLLSLFFFRFCFEYFECFQLRYSKIMRELTEILRQRLSREPKGPLSNP